VEVAERDGHAQNQYGHVPQSHTHVNEPLFHDIFFLQQQLACLTHRAAAPKPLTCTLFCCLRLRAHRFDDVIESKDFTQASFDCLKRILTHMQVDTCTLESVQLSALPLLCPSLLVHVTGVILLGDLKQT
jgi:hypothetical protein